MWDLGEWGSVAVCFFGWLHDFVASFIRFWGHPRHTYSLYISTLNDSFQDFMGF